MEVSMKVQLDSRNKHWILALIVFSAMIISGCVAAPTADQGAYGYMDTVTVTGFGEAYGVPDMATVQFGYSTSNESVETALQGANQTIDEITSALTQQGIATSDIQTTNFSVWPEDQYDPMTGMPTGVRLYRVENTLQVIIRDISAVAQVIEAALDQGANNVYGLTFGIQNTDAIAVQARMDAVANGRVRAEQLAQELGVELGEARIASETYTTGAYDTPEFARGLGGGAGAPSISEGQLVVRVQVNLTFDLIR
jgi:uncharacterized protein YggE